MSQRATGTFDVKVTPQPPGENPADAFYGRMTLDKVFSGDLEAISRGTMIAAGTAVKGSAGYVALEQITGALHGKRGTFICQHFGIMNRGVGELILRVVPDSGTDGLTGLAGQMNIIIESGKHSYQFDYTTGGA
ncbi:MAG TPA: DUF3224 domain-containing protein [Gemmatimonadales bacterium]|jgi:hypothetical protein